MDTTKWKSVLVPIDVYHRIREIAQLEHRPIGSQLRLIFDEWIEQKHNEYNSTARGTDREQA